MRYLHRHNTKVSVFLPIHAAYGGRRMHQILLKRHMQRPPPLSLASLFLRPYSTTVFFSTWGGGGGGDFFFLKRKKFPGFVSGKSQLEVRTSSPYYLVWPFDSERKLEQAHIPRTSPQQPLSKEKNKKRGVRERLRDGELSLSRTQATQKKKKEK